MDVASLPTLLTRDNFKQLFLNNYDTVLLDLDGTLWQLDGISTIPDVAKAYEFLRAAGKNVFFVTNCAKYSRRKLREKLTTYGIKTDVDHIYTSGYATAQYIRQRMDRRSKVYAMVDQGFKEEFEDSGVSYIGYGAEKTQVIPKTISVDKIKEIPLDPEVRAVVVGMDPWFSVTKLLKAASYLQNPKCLFLTTDVGKGVEITPGYVLPGAGALDAAVANAANREAPIVIGKPSVHMFDLIVQEHLGIDSRRSIIIGDKVSTDVKFARVNRLSSILVMTGSTDQNKLEEIIDTVLPKKLSTSEQKKKPSRYGCCKDSSPASPAARCLCVPTFLLPSFGDLGVWAAPPPTEEENCKCYAPEVKSHDVC